MDKSTFYKELRKVADGLGIKFSNQIANVIYQQAKLETGTFTSRRYLEDHNLFGMKAPNSRELYSSISNKFAKYDDDATSIKDYLLRQKQYKISFHQSPLEYIQATLKSGYVQADEMKEYYIIWSGLSGIDVKGAENKKKLVQRIFEGVIIGALIALVISTIKENQNGTV